MPQFRFPRKARIYGYLLLVVLTFDAIPSFSASPQELKIVYALDIRRPATHLFQVSISVDENITPFLDFSLPAWMPGYSKILDFAKNVQEFKAYDGKGQELEFFKIDKQTWRVLRGRDETIKVAYKVFANNLTNINIASHLDETHAFFNGAALFCYVVGFKERPVTLRIEKRPDWKIATGLEKTAEVDVFQAGSYDILIDCPTEIGAFTQYDFPVDGIPHHIAIYGLRDFDAGFIISDISKIVQACSQLFGGLPYRNYTFIYHLLDQERRSGVEHGNSTAIIFNQLDFQARRKYDDFLNLTAHEFFHLWNIKRVHPQGWGPFDYSREAYTKSHWFTEGITTYYSGLILVRSGLWTKEQFYKDMASKISDHEHAVGKKLMSLEEASWNVWLNPDNSANTTISYYIKGPVVGFMLDLEIRKRTGGKKSLDDVMRDLDQSFGQKNIAYKNEELFQTINKISGSDFSAFYKRFIAGTDDLPINDYLSSVGLELIRVQDPPVGYLGIETQRALDNHLRILNVIPGTSGYDSGLDIGDIILALNNERINYDNWSDLLNRQRIGSIVSVTLYHRDCLVTKSVGVGEIRKEHYVLKETEPSTLEQSHVRVSLFGGQSIR
jgi:predicted metalloprotease with PDZ domain